MADETEVVETDGEIETKISGLGELEEQEFKKRQAERDKIGLVEALLLLMLTATADLFEIVTGLTIILWVIGLIFGLFVSGVIFMWAILRGGTNYLIFRRIAINIGGWLVDILSLGILPVRTLALLLTIWYNNRDATRRIEEAMDRIEAISKSASL